MGSIVPTVESGLSSTAHDKLDRLEQAMIAQFPPVECPLTHRFTPGMYVREIFMPAGTLITSKIHKTEHPFTVLSGKVKVWTENDGVVLLEAGHIGVTQPGTRRLLYIVEDCRWVTFHPITETEFTAKDPDLIEDRIIEPHTWADGTNPYEVYSKALAALNNSPVLELKAEN